MRDEENSARPPRRGFCPSAWTPMASGDGLLVRVRGGARALSAAALRHVARLARAHGSGLIELTRRANLQLRGVREAEVDALREALIARGLVETDALRERQRGWLMSDPQARLATVDVEPLVGELERALSATGALPDTAKLTIAIMGSRRSLAYVAPDLQLVLTPDLGAVELHVACGAAMRPLGSCAAARASELVLRLLARVARTSGQRARDLFAEGGPAALDDLAAEFALGPAAPLEPARGTSLGFQVHARPWLGVALPFGAGTSEQWEAIAELAARFGEGMVRLSAERVVLIAGVNGTRAREALALTRAHGLITDADDPRLRMTACVGAPRCSSAWGDARGLAQELVPLLGGASRATLHLSGCEKGCAGQGSASVTLVHTPHGCKLGFDTDVAGALATAALPLESARAQLAARFAEVKVSPPMRPSHEYERDPAAIYRRSFAIIRAEADLARFSPREERVVVRLIHTSGDVGLAEQVVFTAGFAAAAEQAIRRGAPILCDANMIVSGVTRSRLSAGNELLCTLDHPSTPTLAREQRTTRSAAALTLWRDRLEGAVVAIGNAPTALFRLLELLDETAARPAAIIGVPVGFVGAVESKEALLADGRVPAMIVRGRRGGSALAVAAINALARDEE